MVFESVGEKIDKGIADVVIFCDMATVDRLVNVVGQDDRWKDGPP